MKCRITAIVYSEAFLKDDIEIDYGKYHIKFIKGENNKLCIIQVIRSIGANSGDLPKFETNYYGIGKHKVTSFKNDIYNETVELLKYIESIGSYWLGIHRILTGNLKIEYIPENIKEEKEISLYEITEDEGKFKRTKFLVNESDLKNLLDRKQELKHLTIPFSFYREGINEYNTNKFINAFYNFYFFIEGLYSNGKWRSNLVVREYLKSEHIRLSVSEIINTLKNDGEYYKEYILIKRYLEEENLQFDIKGIVTLIVNFRGNLHHFYMKSSKTKGHPLNQEEFRIISFLLLYLCVLLIIKLNKDLYPK